MLKTGICVHFNSVDEMSKKFNDMLSEGFDNCQLISWVPVLWTDENAAAREECARTLFERRIWEVADFYGLAMQLADYFEKDGGDAQSAMEIYDSLLAYPKNDAFERFIVARAESLAKAKSLGLPSNAEIMKKKIAARDAEVRAKKEAEKAAK